MRRRLVTSTAVIALASVLVLGIPLGLVQAARVRSDAVSRLEREADAIAGAIDDRLEARQPLLSSQLSRYLRSGHRAVITPRHGRPLVVGPRLTGDVTRVRAGSPRGALVVAEAPRAEIDTRVLHAWLLIAALAAAGVGAAVALAFAQAGRLARPLESLAETSALLGSGDFSTRAGRFAVPEVDALARVLDATAERIAQLVGREREFSANVSHQLRTPLTALRLRLEELSLQVIDPGEQAEIEAALHETDRLENTIAGLLAYARRAQAGDTADVDLAELTRRHAVTWQTLFRRAGRHLEIRADAVAKLRASPAALGQILDVLLDNALQHGDGDALISVNQDSGGGARVTVDNDGPEVAAELADRIFDRGASDSGGTGIGLHLAYVLARAEGGELRLARRSPPRFELLLRRRPDQTRPEATPLAAPLGGSADDPR